MNESFRLGRLAGVDIGVNWTVAVIFALIAVVLATAQFPQQFPDQPTIVYAAAGLTAALFFFASLLAHELAHAVVARRYDIHVDGITLWLFGGVARLEGEPPDPSADLRVSGVGPLVSVGLSVAFFLVTLLLAALGVAGIVVAIFAWLAAINLVLAVFNLAPAAPLDGGRVLRAVIWRRTGDRYRATELASRAGQVFGFVLVIAGLMSFVFLPGIGGLWIALIGGFIMTAASAEGQQARVRGALRGMEVGDIMTPMPLTVSRDVSVDELIEQYILRTPHSAFPVVGDDERPVGLVTLGRVKRVPHEERGSTRVGDVATPMDEVPVASPDDDVAEMLPRLAGSTDGRALVVEGGRLVGLISARDLMRHMEVSELSPGLGR